MEQNATHLLLEMIHLGRAELPPEQAAALEDHLRRQPRGESLLRDGDAFDQRMRAAMADVPVPPELRGQILDRLSERRAVKFRRRVWHGLAAAAALLVAVTLGYGVVTRVARTSIDVDEIARQYEPQFQRPSDTVEPWLRDQGVEFNPDVAFDMSALAAYERVEFQGRTVPMLLFVRGEAVSRVYVVKAGQFDLQAAETESQGSYSSVKVIADRGRPHQWAYVVVYPTHAGMPLISGMSA